MSGYHSAKQGLVGIESDGQPFSITCEHVTLSSDGKFFMKSANGIMIQIGVVNNTGKTHRRAHDIDCFKLNSTFITFFKQHSDQFRKCKVFTGPLTDLYGKIVFRCSDSTQLRSQDRRIYGRVASALDHQNCRSLPIDLADNLLIAVDSQTNTSFATKGNSGDFVAIEEDESIFIVGIITSGDYIPCHRKGKPPYTICLCLKNALSSMGRKFKELFTSCVTLFFKTPEQIDPLAFNLADRLVHFTNFDIPQVDKSGVSVQLEYEKRLSLQVDSRTDVTTAIFTEDDPLQACIINSVLACASLWDNDMEKGEDYLKNATRCLPNVGPLLLVMFCKVLVYAVWYFRLVKQPHDVKTILDEGCAFMDEFKEYSMFPASSEFYIYFEYSMYYKGVLDHDRATEFARKAMGHSRKSYTDNPFSSSAGNRYLMAVCQYADIKLRCGDNFETRDLDVRTEDIDDVERCMTEVMSVYDNIDPTAQSFYLLRMCDMHFRRNNFNQALEMATKCRNLARKANIRKDRNEAMCRIKALQDYV